MTATDRNHRQDEESAASVVLPILPVKNSVLFPRLMLPLVVSRPASIQAVEAAISTEDKTLLSTETRILCLGPKALKRFRAYWMVIRPFSGIVRKEWLRIAKKMAEANE